MNSILKTGTLALTLMAGLLSASAAPAQGPAAPREPRGPLLYSTHCVACHTTQVHWREKRLAKDWPGLVSEVRRWQANAGQRWGDEDITLVARHLNGLYYHYDERIGPQREIRK
jgi:hypothetical protein